MIFGSFASRIRTASMGLNSPLDLGTPLSWLRGDDSTRSAGLYSSLTDAGSLGGTFNAVASNEPEDTVEFAELKHLPSITGTERFTSSLAANSWNFLHDGSDYTLVTRFYVKELSGSNQFIMWNSNGTNPGIIFRVTSTSKVLFLVLDSSTYSGLTTTDSVTLGWNTVVVRYKSGTVYVQVNGGTTDSASITTTSGSDPGYVMYLGNYSGAVSPLNGFIAESIIYPSYISDGQLASLSGYLERRWGSVPGVRLYLDADLGITLSGSNVSDWADQAIGNDVSQGTASAQPAYSASDADFNSHASIQGAANDGLGITSLLQGTLPQPFTSYSVVTWDATTGNRWIYSGNSASTTLLSVGGAGVRMYAGSNSLTTATAPNAGELVAIEAVANSTSSSLNVRRDGYADISYTADAGSGAQLGLYVLNRDLFDGSVNYTERLAFLMFVDHEPTAAGKSEIRDALASKYGIAAA
jgi:hypothetical protein